MIGNRIQEILEKKGMTQADLARKVKKIGAGIPIPFRGLRVSP